MAGTGCQGRVFCLAWRDKGCQKEVGSKYSGLINSINFEVGRIGFHGLVSLLPRLMVFLLDLRARQTLAHFDGLLARILFNCHTFNASVILTGQRLMR